MSRKNILKILKAIQEDDKDAVKSALKTVLKQKTEKRLMDVMDEKTE